MIRLVVVFGGDASGTPGIWQDRGGHRVEIDEAARAIRSTFMVVATVLG